MTYETIRFDDSDGVVRITLNRPERLNSFTETMFHEVIAALGRAKDLDPKVVLITGEGRGFCAGQDLAERQQKGDGPAADLGETLEKRCNPMMRAIMALEAPVVCAVNGVAAGLGATFPLSCDFVIARQSAKFVFSFGRIGLIPDGGASWILQRLIGPARARGLAMLGEEIGADEAERCGLIFKSVADEEFETYVENFIERLAAAPRLSIKALKKAFQASWQNSFDQQLDLERDLQRKLGQSADYKEGVSAFMEKRRAVFTGK